MLHNSSPQARAASGDVRKDERRKRCRSRACLSGVQTMKSSSTGSMYGKLETKYKHASMRLIDVIFMCLQNGKAWQ